MISEINKNAAIILSLSAALFSGFLFTRLTKRVSLPNVTAYIVVGALIGPHLLNLIPAYIIEGMDFVADIALAFIAFGVGQFLRLDHMKENKSQIITITLYESLMAAAIVTLSSLFIFRLDLPFSLLLGAIGAATAPASTIMTIRQYGAKGDFVNLVLQVVALDDAVALIAFSIATALIQALSSLGRLHYSIVIIPLILNLASIGLGLLAGFTLTKFIVRINTVDNKLIVTMALTLGISGFCAALHVSPLLACMAMGTAYINLGGDKRIFEQVNNFTPPILTLFFVLSGMRLHLPSLLTAGSLGVGYFLVRIGGKYAGAFIGSHISGASAATRKYLGLALVPQAGVSIGLAFLGQRLLPADAGELLTTIILSSSVLYEMVGPVLAKRALILAGAIPTPNAAPAKTPKNSGASINKERI